uniref:Uncharacterized protein n=1 Tax=Arundo donax TaxID=35708 RepID=A0A0A8YVI0_ARUDO
MYFSTRFI